MINQFPVSWKMGALSAEIKRLIPEAVYTSPIRAAVKNERSCTFTPSISYAFIVWWTETQGSRTGAGCVQSDPGEMRLYRDPSSEGIRGMKLRRLKVGGHVGLPSGHSYDFTEST
jgi:hypothetical protein